jgi:hypothetical protein
MYLTTALPSQDETSATIEGSLDNSLSGLPEFYLNSLEGLSSTSLRFGSFLGTQNATLKFAS